MSSALFCRTSIIYDNFYVKNKEYIIYHIQICYQVVVTHVTLRCTPYYMSGSACLSHVEHHYNFASCRNEGRLMAMKLQPLFI